MDMKEYDFAISKLLYTLLALIGVLFILFTGIYWGYTFKENEQYFYKNVTEIKAVNYLNNKYTYDFTSVDNYSDILSSRITNVSLLLVTIGIIILEVGNRNLHKYKYDKPLKQRIIEWYKRLKENAS
jgi:hypothetical protein